MTSAVASRMVRVCRGGTAGSGPSPGGLWLCYVPYRGVHAWSILGGGCMAGAQVGVAHPLCGEAE